MRTRLSPALAAVAILTAATLSAATRLVTAGGADSGNCTVTPCATLTYAIGQASGGDTISVGAGTFANAGAAVVIDKGVIVAGAQAGIDARRRAAAPESILTAPVRMTANSAVLDGFTVSCGACNPPLCGAQCGFGVVTSSLSSGYSVVNNVITGNATGVMFGSSGALTSTLQFNDIFNNNTPGPGPGSYGIFTDISVSNAVVDSNRFAGHSFAQVDFLAIPPFPAAAVTIANNSFPLGAADGTAVVLIGNSGSVISGNSVTGGGSSSPGAIFLAGGNNNVSVTGNIITGTPSPAVIIFNCAAFLGVPSNGLITVNGNTLTGNLRGVDVGGGNSVPIEMHFNRIVANAIDVAATFAINGENNWWGCNAGPAACAVVAAAVDLDPWLVMDIAAMPADITMLQTSVVTADFNQSSNGAAVTGIPDGTGIFFSAVGGTVVGAGNILGGAASTIFTPTVFAPATVTASLDDQTVTAAIMLIGSLPALSTALLALLGALFAGIALLVLRR